MFQLGETIHSIKKMSIFTDDMVVIFRDYHTIQEWSHCDLVDMAGKSKLHTTYTLIQVPSSHKS